MEISSRGTTTADPDVVWSVLSDIEGWPRWLPTVTAVERTGGPTEVGVGSTFAVTQPRLGRAEWTVTLWEPGHQFTWESRRPGVLTTGTHEVRPHDTGSEIELGIDWAGKGRAVARAAFGRMTRAYVRSELDALIFTAESWGGSLPAR